MELKASFSLTDELKVADLGFCCDVTVACGGAGGRTFATHRLILASIRQGPIFKNDKAFRKPVIG